MISDDVVSTLGVIRYMLAVIVPILIYYANWRLLGGRIQFRVLSFLCVALTGLLMTL